MRKPKAPLRRELSPARKRWFAAVTLLVPVLVAVAAELGLRASGYGPDLALFTTEIVGGKTYSIMNPDVKGRYFSRVEFSPNTSLDYFLRPKPAGTFRIFCLGGSTTVGFPYGYIGSFPTFLRDRLRILFPEKTIEVINLGMTATNSYTTVDIAREVADCEPDLIIVYDGHNEFYGALGVASAEGSGGSRWLAKLHLRLVHFRTYQWVKAAVGTLFSGNGGAAGGQGGTMMERLARGKTIPLGSEAYVRALENFRANLEELKEIAARRSVPLMLGSQVSNLRDFYPFVSGPGTDQPPALARAQELIGRQQMAAARELLSGAAAESGRADYHYLLARARERLQDPGGALAGYVRARDLDQLRFRTSSDFNEAIRRACDGSATVLADVEGAFMAASPGSLVGNSLILEHLHPNERGYFLMAKAYLAAMAGSDILAPAEEWSRRDTVADSVHWNNRPATELDELCARRRVDILTSAWPFRAHAITPPSTSDPIARIAERLVRGESTWEEAHVAAAQAYAARNDLDRAAKEYRALVNQIPVNVSAYLMLGQIYLRQQKPDAAEAILKRSILCEPTVFALRALGKISFDRHAYDTAAAWLRRAHDLSTEPGDRLETGYFLGEALWKGGKTAEAERQLAAVLQINPGFRPARALLEKIRARTP